MDACLYDLDACRRCRQRSAARLAADAMALQMELALWPLSAWLRLWVLP